MKITESKLRSIIRSIIVEDDLMRTRLAPMEKTGDYVEDAFALRTVTKDEENAINDMITMPKAHPQREMRITEFGREKFFKKCEVLGIDPERHYDYRLSFSR